MLFHQFISTLFNYLSPPSPGFHCLIFINPLETKHTHTHTPKRQEPSQSISPCGGQGIYQNIHSPSFCLHFVADFSCKSKERPVIKNYTSLSLRITTFTSTWKQTHWLLPHLTYLNTLKSESADFHYFNCLLGGFKMPIFTTLPDCIFKKICLETLQFFAKIGLLSAICLIPESGLPCYEFKLVNIIKHRKRKVS